ncbi:hypothetical protein MIN45_P0122 [Methylomarinovum tepidoasis]|uniref:Microcin J25-processing protein McjB C-terminal domain-containing protein n=1 Tax=Methylomarinovum tepidoasis TaxID=2840183 RepID=A0AAU9BVZ1_9GAMM|nr:lasso peptide biosynthesis B2 protein [Methylomarinovum sp. IN45]BCX87755.1 hypothetical protein MIN45_P0122 [Methylomarinovum sp. IN45]
MRRAQKLRFVLHQLPWIAEAWGRLLLARFRRRPFPPPAPRGKSPSLDVLVRCFQIAAAHHIYRPTCLPRSIALHHFLKRHGHPAVLRIGVRKEKKGIKAHAWVEVDGRIVDDDPLNTQRYQPLRTRHDDPTEPE